MKIYRVMDNISGEIFYGVMEDKFYPFQEDPCLLFCEGKLSENFLSKDGISIDKLKILAPSEPTKVVAIGLNYKGHAKEMGKELPEEPQIFIKPSSAVIGHGDYIVMPSASKRVDYEGELAFVIGKRCKNVSVEDASKYILGYTCLNDVTARDLQKKDIQYTRAKGFDTFCPIGPCIATDVNPVSLNLTTLLNGEIVQKSNTSDMIFNVYELLSFVSKVMTLFEGDVITTGTPAGIGHLKSGDEIEVDIEGIGKLTNFVR